MVLATDKLNKRLDQIAKMDRQLNVSINQFEKIGEISNVEISAVTELAAERLRSVLLTFLAQNYAKSGIGKQTSEDQYNHKRRIIGAIMKSNVTLTRTSRAVKIKVSLPAGESPIQNKNNSTSDFYTVFASLNYGAVRAGQETRDKIDIVTGQTVGRQKQSKLGGSAKRTVKKLALGGNPSTKALDAVQRKVQLTRGPGRAGKVLRDGFALSKPKASASGKSVKVGGAIVIKPYLFYRFTDKQRQTAIKFFTASLIELLGTLVKRSK